MSVRIWRVIFHAGRPDLGVPIRETMVQVEAATIRSAIEAACNGRLDMPDVISAELIAETHGAAESQGGGNG